MASSPPLAFRPWDTTATTSTPALKDVLARVAAERGHFRDITESALLAEIEAPSTPSASPSSDDDNDDDISETSLENEPSPPKTVQQLHVAKNEMLAQIASAQQEIALALDFVSLLSTAQMSQAATTVSPMLKAQGIPMGSLGLDFWNRMPVDRASVDEEARLAKAVRISQLRQSADDLLAAAARLEGNVRREKVFWEQILDISDSGWSVSRIPNTQGLLGVHFGFNGAAREFAARDVAALVAGEEDGGVVLERGVGTKPKAVRVVVRREGRIVGSSRLPAVYDQEDTGLEARIRAARDSLYDEELQHEMVREARGLLSLGVSMRGNTLSFPAGDERTAELELISLDEDHSLPDDSLHGSDHLAQAILLTARLLLSHSHRETLIRKSLPPPPMSEKKDTERPVLALLRPILRLLSHNSDISSLNSYLTNLDMVLGNADIETTFRPAKVTLPIPTDHQSLNAPTLITTLLRPLRSTAIFSIPGVEATTLTLDFGILTEPIIDTYTLSLSPDQTFHLSSLPDLFSATNEFIAAELVSRLHAAAPVSGATWELDRREGRLVRVDREEGEVREVFCCEVDGETGRLELRGEGGRERVVWGLESSGVGSLWEAWRRVTSVEHEMAE